MYRTSFDVSYDASIQDILTLLDKFNLKLASWVTHGPGGGNPELTVTGSKDGCVGVLTHLENGAGDPNPDQAWIESRVTSL